MPFICLLFLLFLPAQASAECINTSCHTEINKIAVPHQPVEEGECLACHVRQQAEHPTNSGKSFTLKLAKAELCYQCHERMGKLSVVHPPIQEEDCLSCHRPHGAANRYLLDTDKDLSSLCFGCHEQAPFTLAHAHGPAASGACTECHQPHESTETKLLVSPAAVLCLNCHVEFAEGLKKSAFVHAPMQKEPCTGCHLPHASPTPALLRETTPELCFNCHSELMKRLKSSKVKHLPLEEGNCASCHLSHYSNTKGLLATGEKSVCFECHDNVRKDVEKKKTLHGPLNEGKCTPCHDPHGGDFTRLLTGRYPSGAYKAYEQGDYDFCLRCHDKNLLRFPETTIYTGFRDGNRNLHYVHVANQRKGRSCHFCHEPHGSVGPKLISKDGMSFGKWDIPIRFEITPTGGSCAPGCHRTLAYDRELPKNPPVKKK